MFVRCPNCGTRLDVTEVTLNQRQTQIKNAVFEIARRTKRPASTNAIAHEIGYAASTIKPLLAHMEHLRILERPNGPKSGWALRSERVILRLAA